MFKPSKMLDRKLRFEAGEKNFDDSGYREVRSDDINDEYG